MTLNLQVSRIAVISFGAEISQLSKIPSYILLLSFPETNNTGKQREISRRKTNLACRFLQLIE